MVAQDRDRREQKKLTQMHAACLYMCMCLLHGAKTASTIHLEMRLAVDVLIHKCSQYLQISEWDVGLVSISYHCIQYLLIVSVLASVIVVTGTVVSPIPSMYMCVHVAQM